MGSRGSNLARKQVEEVLDLIGVDYTIVCIQTVGDRNLSCSLRSMDKTDFFTREIDQMVLQGACDVAIHAAKDLPQPLTKGLQLIALTKGIDARDSLVMREGERLENIKLGATIGSSSYRRDRAVKDLRADLRCVEIRGCIEDRLALLDKGEIDGLVVAEAALIRLGLKTRNRIFLRAETAPWQGKLAVIGRREDKEMKALFYPVDTREKSTALYVGLDPKYWQTPVIHFPVIEIIPRSFHENLIVDAFEDIPNYTHIIFTSKSGVNIFFDCLASRGFSLSSLRGKKIIAIGKITAKHIRQQGMAVYKIAEKETQEGMVDLLVNMKDIERSYLFFPRSSQGREVIIEALMVRKIKYRHCILYDTQPKIPTFKPDLDDFEEIIFTSPSTISAFRKIFGMIPKEKTITPIGPVTQDHLKMYL